MITCEMCQETKCCRAQNRHHLMYALPHDFILALHFITISACLRNHHCALLSLRKIFGSVIGQGCLILPMQEAEWQVAGMEGWQAGQLTSWLAGWLNCQFLPGRYPLEVVASLGGWLPA